MLNTGDEAVETEQHEAQNSRVMEFGASTTLFWKDIALYAKCNPQYDEQSLAWIKQMLGYLPHPHAYLPSLAFIQTLVENLETDKITQEDFNAELSYHVKRIRNQDMKRGGWIFNLTFDGPCLARYNSHMLVYKHAARERLSNFLGYEPLLEYSLEAEMFLRQFMQKETYHANISYSSADYKAATITEYRRVYITKGLDAANAMGLIPGTGNRPE